MSANNGGKIPAIHETNVGWFERLMNGWRHVIQVSERTLVDNVAATVPWLAPSSSAYMIYDNATRLLGWPGWVAGMIAGAVEGLGIAVISTAFTLWKDTTPANQGAPQGRGGFGGRGRFYVAVATVIFYLLTVMSVNVLLDLGFPAWIARALLSLLSVPAAVTIALRTQNAQIREEAAQAKAERREDRRRNQLEALEFERLKKELESSGKVSEVSGQDVESSGKVSKVSHGDWRNLSIVEKDWIRDHTREEVAERYSVTMKTSGAWQKAVAHNGYHKAEVLCYDEGIEG